MGKKKSPPQPPAPGLASADDARGNGAGQRSKIEAAFDTWLDRNLHKLYDTVASEPLPEHLLRLIDSDKRTRDK